MTFEKSEGRHSEITLLLCESSRTWHEMIGSIGFVKELSWLFAGGSALEATFDSLWS